MNMQSDDNDDFSFEIEEETVEKPEIMVEDDTPEEDRGRTPMPKELVEELEADELEEYSEKVKTRLKQMKKVWHDERREKEREAREKAEALTAAQRLLEENRKLKATMSEGEQSLIGSYTRTLNLRSLLPSVSSRKHTSLGMLASSRMRRKSSIRPATSCSRSRIIVLLYKE
jgi:hypothetical protein